VFAQRVIHTHCNGRFEIQPVLKSPQLVRNKCYSYS